MPNPFYYGGRVNPEQFVGRRAELQRIFAGLEVAHTGQMQSFSVVGPRRIGKSSLLFYAANKYAKYLKDADKYRFAYVELSDANCRTLNGLLTRILEELRAGELDGKRPPLVEFQDAIIALKEHDNYPVVCLDEFEELIDHPDQFTSDLYSSWRYLMSNNAIAFVVAAKSSLITLSQELEYTSPFLNVFTHIVLEEFTDDEARDLIARGANCDRPFIPAEQEDILLLAGKHPYKLQLIGSLLYQAKADNRAVDWVELRREFVQQLQQIGLERLAPRMTTWRIRLRGLSSVLAFACYAFAIALMLFSRNVSAERQWVVIIATVLVLVGIMLTLISFGVIPTNDSERTG